MIYISFSNDTSNDNDLQSVYNGNGFLGIIASLQQVFLAIYDTDIIPFLYTCIQVVKT